MHNNTLATSDRAAFLRNIAVHRFHHLPRLVYADWLDEHGPDQPADAKRAEMIRIGHELTTTAEHHKPATWCDCDRCRMMRRLTVMKDEGIHNYEPEPSKRLRTTMTLTVGGFPVVEYAAAYRMAIGDNGVGLELARCFAAWPITEIHVRFGDLAVVWDLEVKTTFDAERQRAAVHTTLTPLLREEFEPDEEVTRLRSPELEWIEQHQWAVTDHRIAPTLEKLPRTVRQSVKRVACEKWSGRDSYRSIRAGRR